VPHSDAHLLIALTTPNNFRFLFLRELSDFSEYIQRFQRVFAVDFPLVVFMDSQHVSELDMSRHTNGIAIIPISIQFIAEVCANALICIVFTIIELIFFLLHSVYFFLTQHYQNYFDRIEEIRNSPLYKRQAQKSGWLQFSPQAALRYYNLLVMSKIFLLR
jgi:hypothetical protein